MYQTPFPHSCETCAAMAHYRRWAKADKSIVVMNETEYKEYQEMQWSFSEAMKQDSWDNRDAVKGFRYGWYFAKGKRMPF
jgi:hypothetical protein